MEQVIIDVRESSGVAAARHGAADLVGRLRWAEEPASTLALAVTEVATNLVKHGRGGEIIARPIAASGQVGVEVLAIDNGPGIAHLRTSMRDGHSTAGSPGFGLGSLARITTDFEVFTQPGKGTALRFEVWPEGTARPIAPQIEVGVVAMAKRGQAVSGDAWCAEARRDQHLVMVVDGLGHGPEAASAARTAVNTLALRPALELPEQMRVLHDALRPTRGAAASLAAMRPLRGTGAFCGVGNVSGATRVAGKTRSLVSHNGTLGHQLRKVQEFDFPFPPDALLILHSDGIATSWNLDHYPGIDARHPALVAAILFRDHQRGSDDATILVVRNRSRRA